MVAKNGHPQKYCSDAEATGEYPPRAGGRLMEPLYNGTSTLPIPSSPVPNSAAISGTPVVVAPPTLNFIVESTQTVHAPNTPLGSFLPKLPLDMLSRGSTFLKGLLCGVLLIALVFFGYPRFSIRHVPVQVVASDKKHAVEVHEQPTMVSARHTFFNKAKGTIFLAGEDNILRVLHTCSVRACQRNW